MAYRLARTQRDTLPTGFVRAPAAPEPAEVRAEFGPGPAYREFGHRGDPMTLEGVGGWSWTSAPVSGGVAQVANPDAVGYGSVRVKATDSAGTPWSTPWSAPTGSRSKEGVPVGQGASQHAAHHATRPPVVRSGDRTPLQETLTSP